MAVDDIHVGGVGLALRQTLMENESTPLDVSTATDIRFIFVSAKKRRFVVSASLVNSGTDGKVEYLTVPGDLDVPGRWQFQAHVVFPAGEWYGDIVSFAVKGNL